MLRGPLLFYHRDGVLLLKLNERGATTRPSAAKPSTTSVFGRKVAGHRFGSCLVMLPGSRRSPRSPPVFRLRAKPTPRLQAVKHAGLWGARQRRCERLPNDNMALTETRGLFIRPDPLELLGVCKPVLLCEGT
jgi:hypothetical protein